MPLPSVPSASLLQLPWRWCPGCNPIRCRKTTQLSISYTPLAHGCHLYMKSMTHRTECAHCLFSIRRTKHILFAAWLKSRLSARLMLMTDWANLKTVACLGIELAQGMMGVKKQKTKTVLEKMYQVRKSSYDKRIMMSNWQKNNSPQIHWGQRTNLIRAHAEQVWNVQHC